jgi:hypothetical protein
MRDDVEIPDAQTDEPPEMETFYPDVVAFVDEWLLEHFKRNPKTFLWDPRWWEITEAVSRLEALWRAWEFYRLEGMTGMAVFFNDYMNPVMRELTSRDGPFWRSTDLGGRKLPEKWPSEKPPADF